MKLYYWFIALALIGYGTGILLESLAYQDDSKIQSLVKTGTFTDEWVPFGIGAGDFTNGYETGYVITNKELLFLKEGYLLVGDPILTKGYIDFTFDVENTGTELANKITECIFQPDDDIPEATCLICNLTDGTIGPDGTPNPIAHGHTDLTGIGLQAHIPVVLSVHPIDENDQWAHSVDRIHGVSIQVCLPGDGGEGCTPGFWKTHGVNGPATPDSWPDTGPTKSMGIITLLESTPYSDVFDEDLTTQMQWTGDNTPSLLDALQAQGGGVNALARHSVAAYLNAITTVGYDIPLTDIFQMVEDAFFFGTFEEIKDIFQAANEAGCPLGNNPATGSDEALALSETGGVDPVTFDGTPDTPYEMKQDAILTLDDLINNPPVTLLPTTYSGLTDAKNWLDESLNPIYWVNDYHIDITNGQIVLDKAKDGVLSLVSISNDPNEDQGVKDAVVLIIDQLLAADSTLAQTAIDDIAACGGKNSKIDNFLSSAQTKMTQAQQDSNDKKYDQALQKFYSAWLDAYVATTACPSGYWTQLDGYTVVP